MRAQSQISVISTGSKANATYPTIAAYLRSNPDVSSALALFSSIPDVITSLGDPKTNGTLFVPSNKAFQKLPKAALDWLAVNPEFLGALIIYHVVPGGVYSYKDGIDAIKANNGSVSLASGFVYNETTDEAYPIIFSLNLTGGLVLNAGSPSPANILIADVKAGASIVHVIDNLILPPYLYSLLNPLGPTIASTLSQTPELSLLWSAIKSIQALYNATLTFGLKWTILAPTNAAFAKLSPYAQQYLADPANSEILTGLLTNHIVIDSVNTYAAGVAAVQSSPTGSINLGTALSKDNVTGPLVLRLNKTKGLVIAADATGPNATVVKADIAAGDSIVHEIDTVLAPPLFQLLLTPPSNPANAISRINSLSVFYNSIKQASGLFDLLSTDNTQFTLFVPTDAAFASLAPDVIAFLTDPANAMHAYELLVYHLIETVVDYSQAIELMQEASATGQILTAPTGFEGQNLTFHLNTTRGFEILSANPRTAKVLKADVYGGRSLIHVIDTVLIPPTPVFKALFNYTGQPSILTAISTIPDISIFYSAVKENPYFSFLSDSTTKMTLFIPTNEAIAKLPPAIAAFIGDPSNSFITYAILVYHFVTQGGPYKYSDGVAAVISNGGLAVNLPSGFEINNGKNAFPLAFTLNSTGGLVINAKTSSPAIIAMQDIPGGRSLIHLIDTVLIPPPFVSLFQSIANPVPVKPAIYTATLSSSRLIPPPPKPSPASGSVSIQIINASLAKGVFTVTGITNAVSAKVVLGNISWAGPWLIDAWTSDPAVTGTFRVTFTFNPSKGAVGALLASGIASFTVTTTQNPLGEIAGVFIKTGGAATASPSPKPLPLPQPRAASPLPKPTPKSPPMFSTAPLRISSPFPKSPPMFSPAPLRISSPFPKLQLSPPLGLSPPVIPPNSTSKPAGCNTCKLAGKVGATTVTINGKTVSYPPFAYYSCGDGCSLNIGGDSSTPAGNISCPPGTGPFSDAGCMAPLNVSPIG